MLVTGTLGLAYPASRAAMWRAVEAAKAAGCKVWKSVGWQGVLFLTEGGV